MKKILGFIFLIAAMFMLTLSANAATYETEDNNSFANADVISQNGQIVGALNNNVDKDYYKVVPSSNGKLVIDFCHTYAESENHWDISVYKYNNGDYIELSEMMVYLNSKEIMTFPYIGAVKNEVYYIAVERSTYNYVVGVDYTIRTTFTNSDFYEKEMNDSFQQANNLVLGEKYNGILNHDRDKDFYKVTTKNDGKLSIEFSHTFAESSSCWRVEVYKYNDGDYVQLNSVLVSLNGKETYSFPFVGAVKNEDYYILVNQPSYNYTTGHNYTLKTSFLSSDYYEKEMNDSFQKANSLIFGKKYEGVLNYTDDRDFYKVTTTNNGKLEIDFYHTFVDNDDKWYIYVYKYNNGDYIQLSLTDVTLKAKETVSLPCVGAVKNEDYYILVDQPSYNYVEGHNYKIKATFTSSNYFEKEPNDSYYQATKTPFNKEFGGVINSNNDNDYFKLVTPAVGTLTLNFLHTSNGDGCWKVYVYKYKNDEYTQINEERIYLSSSEKVTFPTIKTAKNEVYYIKVISDYGVIGHNYSLNVQFTLPSPSKFDYIPTTSTINLKWNKQSGITGYKVYKYNSSTKKYVEIADTNKNNYKISKLKAGTTYKYAIRSYLKTSDATYYSPYVKISCGTTPAQVSNLKVLSNSSKTAQLSYSKVTGASGYQIYYATSKNGTYKKLTSTSKISYTKKNLTTGKTYYFKVRAYKIVDGKTVYGSFSGVKSIKIK